MISDYLLHGWDWNPVVLLTLAVLTLAYSVFIGRRGNRAAFAGALALLALALLSPLELLASGVLFSAHMTQHIILLLLVPALLLWSLPRDLRFSRVSARASANPRPRGAIAPLIVVGWACGVGSMWFWHVPQFCDAAATRPSIHAVQTLSLIAMGAFFWWPILAPSAEDRLNPGFGVGYLFTACLACSALGILITLTPVEVCTVFKGPATAPGPWANLREQLGPARDQQLGGLLMWVPMCLIYVAAILLELSRWMGEARTIPITTAQKGRA